MKKKFFGIAGLFALSLVAGICLAACGDAPWMRSTVGGELPAHVESLSFNSSRGEENGVPIYGTYKGGDLDFYITLEFGWTIGTIKVYANDVEVTDVNKEEYPAEKENWKYRVKKVQTDVEITLRGEAKRKMSTIDIEVNPMMHRDPCPEGAEPDGTDEEGNAYQLREEMFSGYRFALYGEDSPSQSAVSYSVLKSYASGKAQYPLGSYVCFEVWKEGAKGFVWDCVSYTVDEEYLDVTQTVTIPSYEKVGNTYKTICKLFVDGIHHYCLNFDVLYESAVKEDLSNDLSFSIESLRVVTDDLKLTKNGKEIGAFADLEDGMTFSISLKNEFAFDAVKSYCDGESYMSEGYFAINGQKIEKSDISLVGNLLTVSNVKPTWEYHDEIGATQLYYLLELCNIKKYYTDSGKWIRLFDNHEEAVNIAIEEGIIAADSYNSSYYDEIAMVDFAYYAHKELKMRFRITGDFLMGEDEVSVKITLNGKDVVVRLFKIDNQDPTDGSSYHVSGEVVSGEEDFTVTIEESTYGVNPCHSLIFEFTVDEFHGTTVNDFVQFAKV